jgi:hypothetical protein
VLFLLREQNLPSRSDSGTNAYVHIFLSHTFSLATVRLSGEPSDAQTVHFPESNGGIRHLRPSHQSNSNNNNNTNKKQLYYYYCFVDYFVQLRHCRSYKYLSVQTTTAEKSKRAIQIFVSEEDDENEDNWFTVLPRYKTHNIGDKALEKKTNKKKNEQNKFLLIFFFFSFSLFLFLDFVGRRSVAAQRKVAAIYPFSAKCEKCRSERFVSEIELEIGSVFQLFNRLRQN